MPHGQVSGKLHRAVYPFSSFFSSVMKRQSVPWAMIFCGLT